MEDLTNAWRMWESVVLLGGAPPRGGECMVGGEGVLFM